MKRALVLSLAFTLVAALFVPDAAQGRAMGAPTWTSIISYYNPSEYADETGLTVVYYKNETDDTVTEIPSQPIPITAHSSGTLLVGSILKDPEFQGSAVVSATVPILAVYKQSASGSEPYSPVLYNSFAMTESGQYAYLPSVQLNTAYNTQVGIQNLLGSVVTLDLELIDSEDPGVTYSPGSVVTIQPQSSYIFNVSDLVGGGNFTGSMVASAEVLGQPGTPGKIVAVAKDVQGGGRRAYAYEGVAGGSTDVYLPTAMCQYGDTAITTTIDVQNVGSGSAQVWVDYQNAKGDQIATTYTSATTLQAGAMGTFDPCDESILEFTAGQSMTAVVRSDSQPVVAVGKAMSNDGLQTAFTGQPLPSAAPFSDGYYHVSLPYVEWSTNANGYRTYITIMNVHQDEDATDIKALYYGQDGSLIASHTVASDFNENTRLSPYGKFSTSASLARAVAKGSRGFFGAVEIVSDKPIVVLARVERSVDIGDYRTLGEDYTGMYFDEP